MSKRKHPDSTSSNPNAAICDMLIELGNFERNKNRSKIKYNAYKKAAASIEKYNKKLTSGNEAKHLDGVGAKIAKKIDEFLQTGKLKKLCDVRNDKENQIIQQLIKIVGIGPVYANQLVKEGITGIEDLQKHQSKLNHQQKIGLKHFEDFELRIPREEMLQLEKISIGEIKKLDPDYTAEVCGSFRRGAQTCSDIDILMTHPHFTSNCKEKDILKKVVTHLTKIGFVTDILSQGDHTFLGVCRLPASSCSPSPKGEHFRRIDIRLMPHDQYVFALLAFTGGELFNKRMRARAQEFNFTLNDYSLRPIGITGDPGEPIIIATEKEIFEYIDFEYVEPTKRNT